MHSFKAVGWVSAMTYSSHTSRDDANCCVSGTILHLVCPGISPCCTACPPVPEQCQGLRLPFRDGLQYSGCITIADDSLPIYSDSDWAMGTTDRKSYSRIVLYVDGGLVVWFAHKQSVAATLSTEDECFSFSDGTVWAL